MTGSAPKTGGSVSITTSPSSMTTFPSGPLRGWFSSLARHSELTRKLAPNAWMLGIDAYASTPTSDTSIMMTTAAAPRVRCARTTSPVMPPRAGVRTNAGPSGCEGPGVNGLIDGLTLDGLVTLAAGEADRRRKAIMLTPKGEALIDKALPDIFQRMAELTAPLTRNECRTALRLLGKVEDGLRAARAAEIEEEAS